MYTCIKYSIEEDFDEEEFELDDALEIFKDYNYHTLWVLCIYTTALSHVASQFKQHPKLWVAFSQSIKQSLSFAPEQDADLLEKDADLLEEDVDLLEEDVDLLEEDVDLLEDDVDQLERYALFLGKIIRKLDMAFFILDSKEGKIHPRYKSPEQTNGLLKEIRSTYEADVFKELRATGYQVNLLKEPRKRRKQKKRKNLPLLKASQNTKTVTERETMRANEKWQVQSTCLILYRKVKKIKIDYSIVAETSCLNCGH